MLNLLRTITIVCLILISFLTFNLGMDWITFGHGLHPAIAMPISTAAFITIFILPNQWYVQAEDQDQLEPLNYGEVEGLLALRAKHIVQCDRNDLHVQQLWDKRS
jgi:hypothetical protein